MTGYSVKSLTCLELAKLRSVCIAASISTVVAAGCSASTPVDGADEPIKSPEISQAVETRTSPVSEREDPLSEDSLSSERYAATTASLDELVGSAGRAVSYDYTPMQDATHALAISDVVVTGYLVDIVPGVVIASTLTVEPKAEHEVQEILESLDAAVDHLEGQGILTQEIQEEFEAAKDEIRENRPRESEGTRYVAFRVRVHEVLYGDVEVGDMLDINVLHSDVMPTVEEMADILESVGRPPRTVVGAQWWNPSEDWRELHNSEGHPIDNALFPHIDLFWFDGATWDAADEVLPHQMNERPHPESEAMCLDGLHEMEPGWGDLETLDDLADALRSASSTA